MTGVLLAIDPGSSQSAWLVYNASTGGIRSFAKMPNELLLHLLGSDLSPDVETVVIEQIRSYGMKVGAEIFDTVHWAGRFHQAALGAGKAVKLLPRLTVRLAICHDSRAGDDNIRHALMDRWGGKPATLKGGPLYGVTKDVWSALGLAVAFSETPA